MFKKTITYKDFDGNEITEDFYFHLSKPEIIRFGISRENDITKHFDRIIRADDRKEILAAFEEIIRLSYGRRTPDGKSFLKRPEEAEAFLQSNAYEELFIQLFTGGGDIMGEFMNGLMPPDLLKELEKEGKTNQGGVVTHELPDPTREQLLAMSDDEFNAAVGTDPAKMSHEHLIIAMERRSKK